MNIKISIYNLKIFIYIFYNIWYTNIRRYLNMSIQLGNKLQMLRKNLGYTQKDFADFLEIPQPSLSAYENEKNRPLPKC